MKHASLFTRPLMLVMTMLLLAAGSTLANEFSIGRAYERTSPGGKRVIDLTITTTLKEAIDPAQIQLVVHFYVRTASGAVVAVDTPAVSRWISNPVDWATGPEVLQLECPSGPALQGGSYYGVVLGIYYRGRIQASYIKPDPLSDNLPDSLPQKAPIAPTP